MKGKGDSCLPLKATDKIDDPSNGSFMQLLEDSTGDPKEKKENCSTPQFGPVCFVKIWLLLMLMLICCERKTIFVR